jgi:hypothetical protein
VDDGLRGAVVITVLAPDEPDDVLGWPVFPDAQPVSTTDTIINVTAQTQAAGLGRILTWWSPRWLQSLFFAVL